MEKLNNKLFSNDNQVDIDLMQVSEETNKTFNFCQQKDKLRVFEAFAGYGSQSMSLRDIGKEHDVVGISEIEPDAIIAYGAVRFNINELHTDKTHDEMRKELIDKNVGKDFKTGKSKIPRMKKDKLEMLYKFDQAANNFGDISIINPNDLPDFDYFTYSFPCTDISVSGKQQGIVKGGTRSGLLYECEKIIETKRPKYLLMENVKALVSKKFRNNFDEWCKYLEDLGYTNYHNNYKCLNAKDFGIAQNRERIFMISILDENSTYEFPKGTKLNKRLKDFLQDKVEDKYYLSEEIQKRFKPTESKNGYDDTPNLVGGFGDINFGSQYRQGNRVYDSDAIAMCLTASPLGNTGGNSYLYKVDYQNGAIRGKYNENGKIEQQLELRNDGITNTLTGVQKDNVVVEINDKESKEEEIKINRIGGLYDTENRLREAGAVFGDNGLSPTLNTAQGGYRMPLTIEHNTICEQRCDEGLRFFKDNICGTVRTINSGGDKRVIETNPRFRIRKLTPKECLRLMGVSDQDIDKIQSVGLSDSSLYKLAGNSIVKQCLDAVHINLFKDGTQTTPSK